MKKPHFVCHLIPLLGVAACFALPGTADAKPLKVFILAGQSNMQGHARVHTFEHIGMDPQTAPLLKEMQNRDGSPRTCDQVWISYLSKDLEKKGKLTAGFGADEGKIGPEFTFGITMEKELGEPVLLIKTAWGGKSIHTDFRPPSAGPYVFNEKQLANFTRQGKDVEEAQAAKAEATGRYYRLMIEHVRKVPGDIKEIVPGYKHRMVMSWPALSGSRAGTIWLTEAFIPTAINRADTMPTARCSPTLSGTSERIWKCLRCPL